jgi:hypothetical protein
VKEERKDSKGRAVGQPGGKGKKKGKKKEPIRYAPPSIPTIHDHVHVRPYPGRLSIHTNQATKAP